MRQSISTVSPGEWMEVDGRYWEQGLLRSRGSCSLAVHRWLATSHCYRWELWWAWWGMCHWAEVRKAKVASQHSGCQVWDSCLVTVQNLSFLCGCAFTDSWSGMSIKWCLLSSQEKVCSLILLAWAQWFYSRLQYHLVSWDLVLTLVLTWWLWYGLREISVSFWKTRWQRGCDPWLAFREPYI